MKSRRSRTVWYSLVPLLLLALATPMAAFSAPQASSATGGWWNQNYLFRRPLTLSNPSNVALVEQPFLIQLNFANGRLVNAANELRLVNSSGTEVPSYVVDEATSQGFVTSVWLLVVANVPAKSSVDLMIYYGDSFATLPSYRLQQEASSFTLGLHGVSQFSTRPASYSYEDSYGGTYSEAVYSKVSYSGPNGGDFGALEISQSPVSVVSPWQAIGNDSTFPLMGISTASLAQNVRLTQVNILSGSGVLTTYLVGNTGQSSLAHVTLTTLVDASSLALLAPSLTQYDPGSGSLVTTVGSASVGMEASLSPTAYDVGQFAQMENQTRINNFTSRTSGFGQVAGVLSWDLGTLEPGATAEVRTQWDVASSPINLRTELQGVHVELPYSLGSEETVASLAPTADVFWNQDFVLANASLPAGGLTIPLTVRGGTWLPGSATFTGSLQAFLPSADFSPSNSGAWTAFSSTSGNATALASNSFRSVPDSLYVGRTSVDSLNATSTGVALITSPRQVIVGDLSPRFVLRYRASSVGIGSIANQSFFAAVDIDHGSKGTFDQRLIFPVFGTSTTGTACVAPKAPQPPTNVTTEGQLIADGTWRTLTLDLGAVGGPGGFAFQIHFCTSITNGFVGSLQLDLAKAGVAIALLNQGVLFPSMDVAAPNLRLALGAEYSFLPPGAQVTGDLSFVVVQRYSMQDSGGTLFTADASGLPTVSINSTKQPLSGVTLVSSAPTVRISTRYTSMNPALYVGSSPIGGSSVDNGSILASPSAVGQVWQTPQASAIIGVRFQGFALNVSVLDANGAPVPGANVNVTDSFPPIANSSLTSAAGAGVTSAATGSPPYVIYSALTNSQGVATFNLVPWTYNITATFQGSTVALATVTVSRDSSEVLSASVYQTTIKVTDALGSPLSNVLVTGTSGAVARFQGTTDPAGSISIQAAAGTTYHITVSSGGSVFYTGDILVSFNQATILVHTSNYPQRYIEAIVVAVITAAAIAISGVALLRRRARRRSRLE